LVSGLPDLMLSDKKKKAENGNIYAVNNPIIANWLHNDQKGDIELGYYLMFYFAEDQASAIGTCMINAIQGWVMRIIISSCYMNLNFKRAGTLSNTKSKRFLNQRMVGFFQRSSKSLNWIIYRMI
jgi:hypothetical protein